MICFEQYLSENGYDPWHFDCKILKYKEGWKDISTMVNLDNRWFPKGYDPRTMTREEILANGITCGLNEHGKPPTLIHPRPNILIRNGGNYFSGMYDDDYVNRFLQSLPMQEIYYAIKHKIIYILDITEDQSNTKFIRINQMYES